MKLVKINKVPAYYIGKVGDDILINVENIHPFEYPYELYKNIIKISENISKNEVDVYINFSKQYGYLKINKIKFYKKDNNFDFSTEEEVHDFNLPGKIKSVITKENNVNIVAIN